MGISNNFQINPGGENKVTKTKTNTDYQGTTRLLGENVKLSGTLNSDQFESQSSKTEKKTFMQKVGSFFKDHPHAQGCTEMLLGAGAVAAACTFSLPFGIGALAFLGGALCFGAGVMDFDKATEKQVNEKNN